MVIVKYKKGNEILTYSELESRFPEHSKKSPNSDFLEHHRHAEDNTKEGCISYIIVNLDTNEITSQLNIERD